MTPYEYNKKQRAEWDRIMKFIAFRHEKDEIREFWHDSRSEAFCEKYWLLDYKQGRKAGNSISDQTWYTHLDVSGK